MVAKNDITGDSIQTRGSSKEYQENFETIFASGEEERKRKAKEREEYFANLNKKEDFDLESLDPDQRSWYYDDYGIKRKK